MAIYYVIILILCYVTVEASVTITLDNQTPLVLSCSPSSLDITKVQELFCGGQSEDTSADTDDYNGDKNKVITPGNSDNEGGNSVGMQDESRVTPTDAEFWKNGTIITGTLLGGHILIDVVVLCLVMFLYTHDCTFKKKKRPKKLDAADDINSQCPDIISSASISSSGVRSGTFSSRQSLHHSEMNESIQGIPVQVSGSTRSQTFPRNPSRSIHRSVIDQLKKSHNKETLPKVHYTTKRPTTRYLENLFEAGTSQLNHNDKILDMQQNEDNDMTEPTEKPQPVPKGHKSKTSSIEKASIKEHGMQMNIVLISNDEDRDSIERKVPSLTETETHGKNNTLNQTGVLGDTEVAKPKFNVQSIVTHMSARRSIPWDSSDTASPASSRRSGSDLSNDVTLLNDVNKCETRGKNQILATGMQYPKYMVYDSSDTSSTSSSPRPSVDKHMEPVNNNEQQDEVTVQEEKPISVSERRKLLFAKS